MIQARAYPTKRGLMLLALIVLLAALLRLPDLDRAPAGGHGDVAWIGINALDWVDNGIWPYYIRELYAPEPVIVYLTGLAIPFTGVSYLAPRLITVAFGLLFVALLFPATWWLLDDAPPAFRERAGLLASLSAAVSLHAMYLSRLGMESPLAPASVTLLVWMTAWAWRRGGMLRWALAGAALAFTQYIFLPSRLLPLVLALWTAHAAWADREGLRKHARGGLVMILVAILLTLPNIVLFVATPEAFSARADSGTATTGGWIWKFDASTQGGLASVLLGKLGVMLLAFGIRWDGPYTVMGQPMLGPVFFAGFLFALGGLLRWPRRIAYAWPALAIPVMLVTDLISGATVEAHALHQIGVLPFVHILSGVGLGHAWDVGRSRVSDIRARRLVTLGLAIVAIAPPMWMTHDYLSVVIPAQYADPDTGPLIEQIDVDISRRLVDEPDGAYLVPYEEYSRSNVAWLTAAAFRQRRSAIDADGVLRMPPLPDAMTVLMPADPYRIRHDGSPSQLDTRLWVLLVDGQTHLLPPLTIEQERELLGFVGKAQAEPLVDRSRTQIATLYSGPTPHELFAPRQVIDHPMDATFADGIRLRGYTMRSTDLTPGAVTFVTLYWQATDGRPGEDYEIFAQIWNDAGEAVAKAHDFPYGGMYRSRIWRPGEIVATHHWLTVPEDLPAGRYSLIAGLYRLLHNTRVPAQGIHVDAAGDFARIPDLRYPLRETARVGAPPPQPIRFLDVLDVASLDIALESAPQQMGSRWEGHPGQTVTLDIVWDALKRPPVDYSVFLHLTADGDASIVAQGDRLLGGSYPSGAWRAGDRVADRLTLTLPSDLAPGDYAVWLGVYFWLTGERLPVTVDGVVQADQRVWLGSIRVE